MHRRTVCSTFALLALAAVAPAQTLRNYLVAHPDQAGLVVDAERMPPVPNAQGLATYDRKRVQVGSVMAIVPTTMVRFDDGLTKAPNLYDGLPREAKVLYLMSTLTPAQWRKAGGAGIGLEDLRGDQRAVFLSLVPKTLTWTASKLTEHRRSGEIVVGRGTLDEKTTPGLRLKLERKMQFDLPLADEPRSYTMRSTDEEAGQPGEVVYERATAQEREPKDVFGVEVRTVVPNVPKKGNLDTTALNASVQLSTQTTVGEALSQIGRATGLDLRADARVRDRSLAYPGGSARAGDLLDAIALAVAGTYRRVGPLYLLAPDINGAGARALRLSLWKEEIDREVQRREIEWRNAITATGLASNARFDPQDPMSPNEELQSRMRLSPFEKGWEDFYSVDELSPAQRAFLDRSTARYSGQTVDRTKVRIESNLAYRFVLPDGHPLQSEGYLGASWEFLPSPPLHKPNPDPPVPMAANAAGALRPLVVHLDAPASVAEATEVAKAFGFNELWVEAARPEVLSAAVASGLPVRLFARPWALAAQAADPDRTLLGEGATEVVRRMAASSVWSNVAEMIRMGGYPRLNPVTVDGEHLSPFDARWPNRQSAIVGLARTSGLAGVVVADSLVHGYEGGDDHSTYGMYTRPQGESWAFGYGEAGRLALIAAKGIDPIDLFPDALNLDLDVTTPFFPRYSGAVAPSVDTFEEQWSKLRASASLAAVKSLRDALPPDLPVLVDLRPTSTTQLPLRFPVLMPWPRGAEPPAYGGQIVPQVEGSIEILAAPDPKRSDAMADFGNALRFKAPLEKVAFAVDLTRVPPSAWRAILARSLKEVGR